MYELLYSSVSLSVFSELELTDLLQNSRSKNQRLDITGMLVYHEREIMQIIEGEENIVKELYNTILRDKRHASVEILYQGAIEHRSFNQWSMAFKQLDQDSAQKLVSGFEEFDCQKSPISMIKESQNRGKKTFLRMRNTL